MGFIFYEKSPRYAGTEPPQYLPRCKRVGVFVDMPLKQLISHAHRWQLQCVQLHGHENPQTCQALKDAGFTVIKVFNIGKEGLPNNLKAYQESCDYFLFDTACPGHGGSGKSFDWGLLESYHGEKPFILSGGINPGSIAAIKALAHPMLAGIDVNSGFEIRPGLKDTDKLNKFIKEIRQ